MKFLIILMYCDRPNMVRFALDSVAAQDHDNFHLAIIDDSSDEYIFDVLKDYDLKPTVFQVGDSKENKIANGGSRFGQYVNLAIDISAADIGIMLCDDDALIPGSLKRLAKYYENNDTPYSYGHVLTYNPYEAKNYGTIRGRYGSSLNNYDQPINPFCRVDASQVSWRLPDFKAEGIRFPHPQTAALDAVVYQQMYDHFGSCPFNEILVQYKGIYYDQLGLRKDMYTIIDKDVYDTSV